MPSTLSILTATFPAHERGKAIGIWAGFSGIGIAIGPVTGGWLIEHADWSWIFLVNLPVVIARAGRRALPRAREPRRLLAAAGPARLRALLRRAQLARVGADRGAVARLDRRARARRVRLRGARRCVALRRLGAPRARADARHRALPQPALQRLQRRDLARVLRPVRDDLLPHAVPAGGARLLGARRRPAHDAGRRRPGDRRPAVGQAHRAARHPRRRARRPGDRRRRAAAAQHRRRDLGLRPDRGLARAARPRHGHRDGARDRRDHGLAARGEDERRLGDQRHDPRRRRRARRRGARIAPGQRVPWAHGLGRQRPSRAGARARAGLARRRAGRVGARGRRPARHRRAGRLRVRDAHGRAGRRRRRARGRGRGAPSSCPREERAPAREAVVA